MLPLPAEIVQQINEATFVEGQSFAGYSLEEFEGVTFTNCDFSRSSLSGASLVNCMFYSCCFGGTVNSADFSGCRFEGCEFTTAVGVESHRRFTSFVFCGMVGVEMVGCGMVGVGFRSCVLNSALFEDCNMLDGRLRSAPEELAGILIDGGTISLQMANSLISASKALVQHQLNGDGNNLSQNQPSQQFVQDPIKLSNVWVVKTNKVYFNYSNCNNGYVSPSGYSLACAELHNDKGDRTEYKTPLDHMLEVASLVPSKFMNTNALSSPIKDRAGLEAYLAEAASLPAVVTLRVANGGQQQFNSGQPELTVSQQPEVEELQLTNPYTGISPYAISRLAGIIWKFVDCGYFAPGIPACLGNVTPQHVLYVMLDEIQGEAQ